MKALITFAALLFAASAQAGLDIKALATDASVMTRSMDLLFAREEMKESLPKGFRLSADPGRPSDEVARKVRMLTDIQSLEDCKISSKEERSPEGDKVDHVLHKRHGQHKEKRNHPRSIEFADVELPKAI